MTAPAIVVMLAPDADAAAIARAIGLLAGVENVTVVVGERRLAPEAVIAAVAAHFGLRVHVLRGESHERLIARARHIAMYLCKEWCDLTHSELGRAFNRHGTTCMDGVRKVQAMVRSDPTLCEELDAIEKLFVTVKEVVRASAPTLASTG